MTPRIVVQAVAFGLVAAVLIGLVGVITLALLGKSPPDLLANIVTTCVGAVAGLLVRTGADDTPQQVEVVNPPQDPVPTVESGQ